MVSVSVSASRARDGPATAPSTPRFSCKYERVCTRLVPEATMPTPKAIPVASSHALVADDEVSHEQLGYEETEWHHGVEQGGHPDEGESLHQVFVPHAEEGQQGRRGQQPIRSLK